MGHKKLLVGCALALALAGPAAADYVTGLDPQGDNFLSLRNGPGTGYSRVLKLAPNTELTVIGISGKWRKVVLNDGTVGWAYGKYIAPGAPPGLPDPQPQANDGSGAGRTGRIGAALLATDILTSPFDGAAAVTRLRNGGGVIVLNATGNWLRVISEDGVAGYARVTHIAVGATPSPVAARPVSGSAKGAAKTAVASVGGWTRYVNPRFGTHIDYPAGYFRAGPAPANGDGLNFKSANGRSEFLVFGQYNVLNRTLDQMRADDKANGGYDSVTYERTKGDWYVLSGYIGGHIFYRRVTLDAARDTVHVFEMTFDPADKPLLEPALTRMSRSFGHE